MRNVRQADMGEYPPVFLLSLLMGLSQALAGETSEEWQWGWGWGWG